MDEAFEWAKTNPIPTEADYPYTSGRGERGSCDKTKAEGASLLVSDYTYVPQNDADQLKAALDKQPVSLAVEADRMAF